MNPRGLITTALEIIGMGLVVAGVAMFSTPLALIAAGVGLVVVGLVQS